jgi:hypothetical protein
MNWHRSVFSVHIHLLRPIALVAQEKVILSAAETAKLAASAHMARANFVGIFIVAPLNPVSWIFTWRNYRGAQARCTLKNPNF